MSKYKKLYDYCQTLAPKVSRKDIQRKTLEITGVKKISVIKSGLDISVCRGLFISAANTEHRLVQQLGTNVIVLAREMNYCWDRFVHTKELMHLFDDDDEPTDTAEKFESLLSEFEIQEPQQDKSKQFSSEIKCFWMALACLCPEKHRLQYLEQLSKGHIDEYGVALQLRIPQQYIRQLVNPNFTAIIKKICGES